MTHCADIGNIELILCLLILKIYSFRILVPVRLVDDDTGPLHVGRCP